MYNMFYGCSGLTDINLDLFETSNLKIMSGMFYGCKSLSTLNLSKFVTTKVEKMDETFAYCSSLESLDIRNFDTSLIDEKTYLFIGISEIGKLIYNSKTFDNKFIKNTNVEKWEKEDISKN